MEAEAINQLNNTLSDLESRSADIRVYLDYAGKKERLEEVVGLSEDPELWNDPKKAQEIGKERKMLEGIVLGCFGGIIATLALRSAYGMISTKIYDTLAYFPLIPTYPFLNYISLTILISGMIIGALGSTISLKRFLKA